MTYHFKNKRRPAMNNILKVEDIIQHSRYKIYEKYYGMWNDERVVAFTCVPVGMILVVSGFAMLLN